MGAREVSRAHAVNATGRRAQARSQVHDGGSDAVSPQHRVAEIQRRRLLIATIVVLDELGYAELTVAQITARAHISRRTFYELFDNREECIAAVYEDTHERLRSEMAADVKGLPWAERIRTGLWTILSFFDREPALARVCLVQTARGNEAMLARRTEVFERLASAVQEGRSQAPRGGDIPPLTAEGLVGAVHAIVYERVLKRSPEPLVELLPPLMSMIVLPYRGAAVARRERSRLVSPKPAATKTKIHDTASTGPSWPQGLPMRLTYRTIRVLQTLGESPGISNRTVGDEAGVTDQGQISKLLARLERLGLIANSGEGHAKGEANAWTLTSTGEQLRQNIHPCSPKRVRAA
jgi:AcrR family transcriptional regulator/DNA-binding MarR family transcriptional regulator